MRCQAAGHAGRGAASEECLHAMCWTCTQTEHCLVAALHVDNASHSVRVAAASAVSEDIELPSQLDITTIQTS